MGWSALPLLPPPEPCTSLSPQVLPQGLSSGEQNQTVIVGNVCVLMRLLGVYQTPSCPFNLPTSATCSLEFHIHALVLLCPTKTSQRDTRP